MDSFVMPGSAVAMYITYSMLILISVLGIMLRPGWVMLSNNRWVFRVSTRSALNNAYAVSTIPFATAIFAVVALFCFVMMLTSGMRQGQ